MKIALDIDEVLLDTLKQVVGFYNAEAGTDFNRDDFHTYSWWDVMGIGRDETFDLWYRFNDSEHGRNIPPMNWAVEGVRRLGERNDLVAVTDRNPRIEENTKYLLEKHFPDIGELHFSDGQKEWGGVSTKADILKEESVKLMIEDKISNAEECRDVGANVFLFDSPWNRDVGRNGKSDIYVPHQGITRVYSWYDIVDRLAD